METCCTIDLQLLLLLLVLLSLLVLLLWPGGTT